MAHAFDNLLTPILGSSSFVNLPGLSEGSAFQQEPVMDAITRGIMVEEAGNKEGRICRAPSIILPRASPAAFPPYP